MRNRQRRGATIALAAVAAAFLAVDGVRVPAGGQDSRQEIVSRDASVWVRSDPTSQAIILDGSRVRELTPVRLELPSGQYTISVEAQGYEPLSHDLILGAGQQTALNFVLMKTAPEKPSQAELMALTRQTDVLPQGGTAPGSSEHRMFVARIQAETEACAECHSEIKQIQAKGLHNTLRCSVCHGDYGDHVKDDGRTIGPIDTPRRGAVETLCVGCHDREEQTPSNAQVIKVDLPEHLEEKRVRLTNLCEQCHHVHAPQKWVFESREMAGLPALARSLPPLNEDIALTTKERFNSMMETFFVVPFSLGVIGKIAFSDDGAYPSNELLASGAFLVAGSWFLGKVFYARRLEEVRLLNQERARANERAAAHNEKLERELAKYYTDVARWVKESEGRGVVVIQGQ